MPRWLSLGGVGLFISWVGLSLVLAPPYMVATSPYWIDVDPGDLPVLGSTPNTVARIEHHDVVDTGCPEPSCGGQPREACSHDDHLRHGRLPV